MCGICGIFEPGSDAVVKMLADFSGSIAAGVLEGTLRFSQRS